MRLNRIISGVLLGLAPLSAAGQPSFDVIRSDLSREPGRLVSISADTVTFVDVAGEPRAEPLSDVLGLERSGDAPSDRDRSVFDAITFEPSMLRLVDGRRLTGTLSGEPGLPETLRWQHPVLGKVDVPLEQIDRLSLQRASLGRVRADLLPPAERDDVLLLRNGDRLEGFVIALDRDAVIDVGGREIAVPMESVHQVALANPRSRWLGPMVWLRDGSVLGASGVRLDDRLFTLLDESAAGTEASAGATVRPEHVAAVAFDTRSLVPVSSLIQESTDDAAHGRRSPFDAAPIVLEGATVVGVELPAGATRLSLVAALPLRAQAWGRFEVLLTTDGVIRARLPLSTESSEIAYEIDLTGARRLEIELVPGAFGRVQAVAEIREALIAIE